MTDFGDFQLFQRSMDQIALIVCWRMWLLLGYFQVICDLVRRDRSIIQITYINFKNWINFWSEVHMKNQKFKHNNCLNIMMQHVSPRWNLYFNWKLKMENRRWICGVTEITRCSWLLVIEDVERTCESAYQSWLAWLFKTILILIIV